MEELLQIPNCFNPLKPNETFEPIAQKLMKDYCIKCGGKFFFFAEIEFYYYRASDKEALEKAGMNWEGVTYTRNTNAGDLFYHLSGCDICFKSVENECGGILIRSLIDESEEIVAGPMNCVNAMLNACGKNNNVPSLFKKGNPRNVDVRSTYRFLGDDDFKKINNGNKDGELKLAFYNSKIEKDIWKKKKNSYNYYLKRFKYANN